MYRYTSLCIILISSVTVGDNLNYNFTWFNIPVADFVLTDNLISSNSEKVKFQIFTKGPLKLYRNYSSSGYIKQAGKHNWEYYLKGIDRGKPEEKHILYFSKDYPIVVKFIDDDGYPEIEIDKINDIGSIDPFTILLRAMENLAINQDCTSIHSVMDGKRRYEINVELISQEELSEKEKIYHCRFYLSEMNHQKTTTKKHRWPFNKGLNYIDIWFSNYRKLTPSKFNIQTPIGKIVGNIKK